MQESAKKLLFVAPACFGHINQMIVLAREVRALGHRVAFACTEQYQDRILSAGIEFLRWEPEETMTDSSVVESRGSVWSDVSKSHSFLWSELRILSSAREGYSAMYASLLPIWKQFAPELVVADSAVVPAFDMAIAHGVPYIVQLQFLGNHSKISARYPRFPTSFSVRMTPLQRIANFLLPLILPAFLPELYRFNKVRAQVGATTPLMAVYEKTMVLVCSAFGVEIPRALPPLFRMVGPIFPPEHEPLDSELSDWLAQREDQAPAIYMSFGTLATLEPWQAETLLEGLNDPRWRILWSLRPSEQKLVRTVPANFCVRPFVPQQAVLAHPNVRAFVSHCGMNSISESFYHGKPILALPMFGDQHYNAARVEDVGAGLRLNKRKFNAQDVRHKMQRLLDEPKFSDAARKLSAALRQTRGLEDAVRTLNDALVAGFDHLIPERLYRSAQKKDSYRQVSTYKMLDFFTSLGRGAAKPRKHRA